MNQPRWITDLVQKLQDLADPADPDRAALAHLRRSLATDPAYVLARVGWLFRAVPGEFRDLDNAILVAGLFALTKGDCPNRKDWSFGRAFGSLPGKADNTSIERRFIDLLDTDIDDLRYKLRQALTLVAPHQLPLDWELLLVHLRQWDHPDRRVQKWWARDFWAAASQDNSDMSDEPSIVES
jgi:CRISPR system Cascade subunit CasB